MLLVIIAGDGLQQMLLFSLPDRPARLCTISRGRKTGLGTAPRPACRRVFQDLRRVPGAGHHGGIEERQNIAGFIQRRHRVMISGDNHR